MGAPINVQMFDIQGMETPGVQPVITMELDFSSITVAELIEQRIRYEYEKGEGSLSFIPHPDEVALNEIRKSDNIDDAVDYAQKAFKAGEYFLFVNEVQVESLEEKVALKEESTVKFIQLIPLAGG